MKHGHAVAGSRWRRMLVAAGALVLLAGTTGADSVSLLLGTPDITHSDPSGPSACTLFAESVYDPGNEEHEQLMAAPDAEIRYVWSTVMLPDGSVQGFEVDDPEYGTLMLGNPSELTPCSQAWLHGTFASPEGEKSICITLRARLVVPSLDFMGDVVEAQATVSATSVLGGGPGPPGSDVARIQEVQWRYPGDANPWSNAAFGVYLVKDLCPTVEFRALKDNDALPWRIDFPKWYLDGVPLAVNDDDITYSCTGVITHGVVRVTYDYGSDDAVTFFLNAIDPADDPCIRSILPFVPETSAITVTGSHMDTYQGYWSLTAGWDVAVLEDGTGDPLGSEEATGQALLRGLAPGETTVRFEAISGPTVPPDGSIGTERSYPVVRMTELHGFLTNDWFATPGPRLPFSVQHPDTYAMQHAYGVIYMELNIDLSTDSGAIREFVRARVRLSDGTPVWDRTIPAVGMLVMADLGYSADRSCLVEAGFDENANRTLDDGEVRMTFVAGDSQLASLTATREDGASTTVTPATSPGELPVELYGDGATCDVELMAQSTVTLADGTSPWHSSHPYWELTGAVTDPLASWDGDGGPHTWTVTGTGNYTFRVATTWTSAEITVRASSLDLQGVEPDGTVVPEADEEIPGVLFQPGATHVRVRYANLPPSTEVQVVYDADAIILDANGDGADDSTGTGTIELTLYGTGTVDYTVLLPVGFTAEFDRPPDTVILTKGGEERDRNALVTHTTLLREVDFTAVTSANKPKVYWDTDHDEPYPDEKEWQDWDCRGIRRDMGDIRAPMCFISGSRWKAEAWFQTSLTATDGVQLKGEGAWDGESPFLFPAQPATFGIGGLLHYPVTECTTRFPRKVCRFSLLRVKWSIKVGDGDWREVGESGNEVFVVGRVPPTSGANMKYRRSVLYLATLKGSLFDATAPADVFAAQRWQVVLNTWEGFGSRRVVACRKPLADDLIPIYDVPLHYYKSSSPPSDPLNPLSETNLDCLLAQHDGDCGAWTTLLMNALYVNGGDNLGLWWCTLQVPSDIYNGSVKGFYTNDLRAQNGKPAKRNFGWHAAVKMYDGGNCVLILDPSYGIRTPAGPLPPPPGSPCRLPDYTNAIVKAWLKEDGTSLPRLAGQDLVVTNP